MAQYGGQRSYQRYAAVPVIPKISYPSALHPEFFKRSWIPYIEPSMGLLQEPYDTYRHQRTPCYEKGLCEHCCEHAMSDDDLREMVEFRGYKMTDRMTEAFEGKSDNFNKCMEKLLNISLLIEEFESGKLDSEKTMRLIKDIVEAPVYP